MKDISLYEKPYLPDRSFPVSIFTIHKENSGPAFLCHWHKELELLYFTEGTAVVECNSVPLTVEPGTLVVVNNNDLHYVQSLKNPLTYHCIIIGTSLLESSNSDACEVKYIAPIAQKLIVFRNIICNDSVVNECISSIVEENENKYLGYELSIKSSIYKLLVKLLRNHVEKILTQKEYDIKVKNLEMLANVLKYLEINYHEQITIEYLAKMAGISNFYFCHLFKKVTGKTLSGYVNNLRINKAESLLKTTDMNITEIALTTGFNDINYFSRLFKKYKNESPSLIRKMNRV